MKGKTPMDVDARSAEDSTGEINELASSDSLRGGVVDASGSLVDCLCPSRSPRSHVWRGAVNGSAICSANQIARMLLKRDDTG